MEMTTEEETSRTQKKKNKEKNYIDELEKMGVLTGYAKSVLMSLDNIQYKDKEYRDSQKIQEEEGEGE